MSGLAHDMSLMKGQSKSLKNIQRRALQIIVNNVSYEVACDMLNLSALAEHRLTTCSTLLQITGESNMLQSITCEERR